MALATSVVDVAVRHADGRRVTSVALRIGGLRQVVPTSLEFYFEICGRDTLCEGAKLDYELIATRLACRTCSHEWEPDVPFFFCPECASSDCAVTAGEEFEIESIVVEEDAVCTGSR